MATQNFINECKNRANANRLGRFELLTLHSKNIFNKYGDFTYGNDHNQTSLNSDGQIVTVANYGNYRSSGLLIENVEANTDYTVSGTLVKAEGTRTTQNAVVEILPTTGSYIERLLFDTSLTKPYNFNFTFNTGNNTSIWVSFSSWNASASQTSAGQVVFDKIQIEKGTTATSYVPYISTEINQTNFLKSIELKDSCCVNNEILGSIYTKSAEVQLLNIPADTELEGQKITPEIGVKYSNDTTEYITFDEYTIESINDEQTASNTGFTAMNGGTLLDKEYVCSLSFENGETHTINEFYQDACSQIGLTPLEATFDNSEIELTGNPFTNKETIRTVLSEVEKTSCSIAKFDWTNLTISLTWLSDQIDYEFNTSDYSTLEGSLTQYGPLNVIIIANAELNGENVVMTDTESVEENGEHQIIIDSPYFLYTEELRTQAIQAIYDKLDGLTYYDLKLTTPYGKPFLEIGDKIRINTNEEQVLDTYVLSHTFTYDGTFQSIIESPALTQEEQTVKNEFKSNSLKERMKRTELIVDKTTGDITAITQRVISDEENTYTKEETNLLVQNATEGITNKFINSGGNNILRNTGLWFEDTSNVEYLYPSNDLYPDNELYILAEPYFEYWQGKVVKGKEDDASNNSCLILQANTLSQSQQVRNGLYTVSFKYKKLINLATARVVINDEEFELSEINDTEFVRTIEVNSQIINIGFICDTDNGVEIYDLMVNAGSEKAEYSQHQNETTTDTVNISKGITITSSDTNTTFKADSDGIRVFNSRDMQNPITTFTETGMTTKKAVIEDTAEIVEVLFKKVGSNTWITKL